MRNRLNETGALDLGSHQHGLYAQIVFFVEPFLHRNLEGKKTEIQSGHAHNDVVRAFVPEEDESTNRIVINP